MAKYRDEVELYITARNEARAELQAADKEARRLALEQQRHADTQARRARQVADVEAQIEQTALRRRGLTLQADLAQVRRHYGQRIAAAKAANDAELADRLATLQKLKEADARAENQARADAKSRQGDDGALFVASGALTRALGAGAALEYGSRFGSGIIDGISAAIRGDAGEVRNAIDQLPVVGSVVGLGASIREAVLGEQRELKRINELIEERNRASARTAEWIKAQREEARKQREELERIARLEVQRQGQLRAANALAIQQENARRRAVEQADGEIEDLQLRRQGRVLEAELAAVTRTFNERRKQARTAGNFELENRLYVIETMKQAEIKANAEVQRQRERLDGRIGEGRDRIADLREQLATARRAEQASRIPRNQANTDRFLTGVREDTQTIERSLLSEAQTQTRALEQLIRGVEAQVQELTELRDELAAGPRIVVGRPQ